MSPRWPRHGARIFRHDPEQVPLSRFDDWQLNAEYSTLLAVRRPGVPAAEHPEPVPLQDFLWRLVAGRFRGPVPTDFRHFVRRAQTDVDPSDGVRVLTEASMPWAARGARQR